MSDVTTVARPYAKAVFEHALAEKNLAKWSEHLSALAQAIATPEVVQFIANPASASGQHAVLLESLINKESEDQAIKNFITMLAQNKRLLVLPEIKALYEAYKTEQEKTLQVDVRSFSALTPEQEVQMTTLLSKRLQRNVTLNISIDPTLIGGAVLKAGDLTIDGSIIGKLARLKSSLIA